MSNLKGYVGPTDKIEAYFGRPRKANAPSDVARLSKLLNTVPTTKGGPAKKLDTSGAPATFPAVFAALEKFQRDNKILNRKTKEPFGWTGPRGKTIPTMKRAARRATGGKIDVSQISFSKIWRNHLSGKNFRAEAGHHVYGSNGVMSESPNYWDINTCALRMSYALYKSGKQLRPNSGSWKFNNGRTIAWLTSTAKRITNDLAGGREISGRLEIAGEKGIIAFVGGIGGATGHVTLWNGSRCHFNDGYFSQAKQIYFFPASY